MTGPSASGSENGTPTSMHVGARVVEPCVSSAIARRRSGMAGRDVGHERRRPPRAARRSARRNASDEIVADPDAVPSGSSVLMMVRAERAVLARAPRRSTTCPGYSTLPRSSLTMRTMRPRDQLRGSGSPRGRCRARTYRARRACPRDRCPTRLMNAFTTTGSMPRRGLSRISCSTCGRRQRRRLVRRGATSPRRSRRRSRRSC